jgi:hypothetical protein
MKFRYVVYKLTFPNGKIYIGKDIGGEGHSIRYFGSWDNATVSNDFSKDELSNFTLKKEIVFESESRDEVSKKEIELILAHNSNNPSIGYNRTSRKRVNQTKISGEIL